MRVMRGSCGLIALAIALLLVPGGAAAATVINGGFESGSLGGWNVHSATQLGDWFAYQGTTTPIGSKRGAGGGKEIRVQPPPQGAYAAISDQLNPDSLILYQDVALEAGGTHWLSLLAYYDSYAPIAVPTPNSLSVDEAFLGGQSNQQYRIDVIRPDAPVESLDAGDVLRTLFETKPAGSKKTPSLPVSMAPTLMTADLSAFADQTVRLRIASAASEEILNAGVDAVTISSSAPGQSPSRGTKGEPLYFSFGKVKVNRRNGTATLQVRVFGPGLLRAKGTAPTTGAARASKAKARAAIKPVGVRVASARTVTIRLRPTPYAQGVLRRKHKLRVRVAATFTPAGGSPETASLPVVLRLSAKPQRGH